VAARRLVSELVRGRVHPGLASGARDTCATVWTAQWLPMRHLDPRRGELKKGPEEQSRREAGLGSVAAKLHFTMIFPKSEREANASRCARVALWLI